MSVKSRTRLRTAVVAIATMLAALLLGTSIDGQAQAATSEGLQCETSPSNSFSLTATSGYILTPDGNSIFMWGYAGTSGLFQLPGPTLCVPEGATVTVVLKNLLREPVSIVFPGQTGVSADGSPAQPTYSGTTLTSLVKPAAAQGGTVTYSFVASRPGSYLYESGTDVAKQVQMGLYGALVVRPTSDHTPTGTVLDQAYDDPASAFDPRHEYLHLLSEIDPAFHLAVERNRAFDLSTLRSRYFLINGRSMPDTIAPNNAAWLPSQPYGATVHITPKPVGDATFRPALIRYLNAGTGTYPFHPHGNDQRVVGQDGSALIASDPDISTPANPADASYEKFLIDIGPGQTVDSTLTWTNIENWTPDTNPIPVDLPPLLDQIVTPDTWFSESPYLGLQGDFPPNVTSNNQCGEYYHVAHSHALQQATNYGATFGGMMTLIRIDPPAPSSCPAVTP
jgi:FtsP/CotA-like multicopper oxidase with cupredoxin domain